MTDPMPDEIPQDAKAALDALEPCPFCGCRDCSGTVKIKCPQCGASGAYAPNEKDAAAKWNKRSRLERSIINTGLCKRCNTQLGHDDDGGSVCRFCDAEPSPTRIETIRRSLTANAALTERVRLLEDALNEVRKGVHPQFVLNRLITAALDAGKGA